MSAYREPYPSASQQNIDNYLSFLWGNINENNTVQAKVSMYYSHTNWDCGNSENGITVKLAISSIYGTKVLPDTVIFSISKPYTYYAS
jgi:hypothetical protein